MKTCVPKLNLENMLTSEEAGRYLGLATDTIRRYVYRGMIDGYSVGRTLYFSRESLDKFQATKRPPGKPRKNS